MVSLMFDRRGAISQEPFVWDSVASASIKAIQARYAMLPYWLTLFAEASQYGMWVVPTLTVQR
jgi:alpha-glucosidase